MGVTYNVSRFPGLRQRLDAISCAFSSVMRTRAEAPSLSVDELPAVTYIDWLDFIGECAAPYSAALFKRAIQLHKLC